MGLETKAKDGTEAAQQAEAQATRVFVTLKIDPGAWEDFKDSALDGMRDRNDEYQDRVRALIDEIDARLAGGKKV